MPNDRGGAEADGVARILEAPADIDIVAGGAVDRIEAAEPKAAAEAIQAEIAQALG